MNDWFSISACRLPMAAYNLVYSIPNYTTFGYWKTFYTKAEEEKDRYIVGVGKLGRRDLYYEWKAGRWTKIGKPKDLIV